MTLSIIDYIPKNLYAIAKDRGWLDSENLNLLKLTHPWFSNIDRTQTLTYGIPSSSLYPIPSGFTSKSFEEICNQEAVKLIESGRSITVYWSGGIDSTLVLVSLLKNGAKDLTVAYTGQSIVEYPLFYEKFIKDKLPSRRIRASVFSDVDINELIVTGEHGDQIMGSDTIRDYIPIGFESIHRDPWQKWISHKSGDSHVEYVMPQVEKAPFKIITAFDYAWWKNYSTKWQHVALRMSNNCNDFGRYQENIRHFYGALDFQRWAINEDNHRIYKIKDTYRSYKHLMKKIIGDWTLDRDYQENKTKEDSLPTGNSQQYILRLSDGTTIGKDMNRYTPEEYNKKYGNTYDYLFGK